MIRGLIFTGSIVDELGINNYSNKAIVLRCSPNKIKDNRIWETSVYLKQLGAMPLSCLDNVLYAVSAL